MCLAVKWGGERLDDGLFQHQAAHPAAGGALVSFRVGTYVTIGAERPGLFVGAAARAHLAAVLPGCAAGQAAAVAAVAVHLDGRAAGTVAQVGKRIAAPRDPRMLVTGLATLEPFPHGHVRGDDRRQIDAVENVALLVVQVPSRESAIGRVAKEFIESGRSVFKTGRLCNLAVTCPHQSHFPAPGGHRFRRFILLVISLQYNTSGLICQQFVIYCLFTTMHLAGNIAVV